MSEDKMLELLEEIARTIGGDDIVKNLKKLAEHQAIIHECMKKSEEIKQKDVDNYNRLLKEIYPEKFEEEAAPKEKISVKAEVENKEPDNEAKIASIGVALQMKECAKKKRGKKGIAACELCPLKGEKHCEAQLLEDGADAIQLVLLMGETDED